MEWVALRAEKAMGCGAAGLTLAARCFIHSAPALSTLHRIVGCCASAPFCPSPPPVVTHLPCPPSAQDRRLQRLGSLLEQLQEHCAVVGEGSRQAMAAVHHSLRAFW